jgi:hypothetical protein
MMNRSTSLDADEREKTRRRTLTRPIRVTDDDVREFELAMANYKERSGRLFPTCSELLEVLRELGYAKRIWRPVATWAPITSNFSVIPSLDGGSAEVFGWFSSVETESGY